MSPGVPGPGPDPDRAADRSGFAAELGRLKNASGLSFRAISRATKDAGDPLGLPFTTIRDYVQGNSLPSTRRLDVILTAVGVPAEGPERERWHTALWRASSAPARPSGELRPYPGTAPYTSARWLHGRDEVVRTILDRIAPGTVLPVTGHSGAGTTSVLRAGVLPALDPALGPVAELTPGPDPAGRLAALLDGPAGVVLVDDVHRLLLAATVREREQFLLTLTVLLDGVGDGPAVLVGMRDHLHRELTSPHAAGPAPVVIGPPEPEQLCEMLAGPAREAGFPLADGLVDVVLGELEILPGAPVPPGVLALATPALTAAWERAVGEGGTEVTVAHYRAGGGVGRVIAESAEAAWEGLTDAQRIVARPMLLRLTQPAGVEGAVGPGRVRLFGLAPRAATPAIVDHVIRVLGALVDARIVVADERDLWLAHDLVLRAWPRLAEWSAADSPIRFLVSGATRTWEIAGRDETTLLRDQWLDEAVAYLEGPGVGALFPTERAYVEESVRARERGVRAHRTRRMQAVLAVMAVLVVLMVVVVVA